MYSVMIARYKFFPEVKTKGMTAAPRLVLFTSEHVSLIVFFTHLQYDIVSLTYLFVYRTVLYTV